MFYLNKYLSQGAEASVAKILQVLYILFCNLFYIIECTTFFLGWMGGGGGGELNLLPNFQKRGLDTTLIFKGGLVRKRWWPFWGGGGYNFYIKNNLRSEI